MTISVTDSTALVRGLGGEPFDYDDLRRRTREELSFAQSKLGDFLDLVPAGLLIHEPESIIFSNDEAARLLGISNKEIFGRHFLDFVAPEATEHLASHFRDCFQRNSTFRQLELSLVRDDHVPLTVFLSMSRLFWEGLPVINIVISDITELKDKERELFVLSTTDSLTGVFNRRYFYERAAGELRRAARYGQDLAVLVLDIDRFKAINDSHGHAVGDLAIQALVGVCRETLRDVGLLDLIGRIGGEEFALLLPETDLKGALVVAERLRRLTAATVLPVADSPPLRFTVSIGVSLARPDEESIEPALRRADGALYDAKNAGRDRVAQAPA